MTPRGMAPQNQMTSRMPERPRRGKSPTLVVRHRGPSALQKLVIFVVGLVAILGTTVAIVWWKNPELLRTLLDSVTGEAGQPRAAPTVVAPAVSIAPPTATPSALPSATLSAEPAPPPPATTSAAPHPKPNPFLRPKPAAPPVPKPVPAPAPSAYPFAPP
jgi:hypothetical protein